MFFEKKTVFFTLGRIFVHFLEQNAKKALKSEKHDSLKTISLPRENDDFQGSAPVPKRHARLLIRSTCY